MPIEADGFEFNGKQTPRPRLRISNILGTFTTIILTLPQGLEGAQVTRIRTLARYVDNENFTGGEILLENGSKVKMSTRSGNFYTLKQLIDDIGPDASRFYYLSKQADQHLDFDIGVARSNSKENLYYYVQYAHARICSVEKKYIESGLSLPERFDSSEFEGCDELLQMAVNAQFVIKNSGENLQPHLIVYYLRDMAQSFHQFYNTVNILKADESEQNNIMRSLIIVKAVIASSLELLGIEPLDSM